MQKKHIRFRYLLPIFLIAFSVLSAVVPKRAGAAPSTDYIHDVQRRKLLAFKQCIQKKPIYEGIGLNYFDDNDKGGNNIDDIEDIFQAWVGEYATVGLDVNSSGAKGVTGCKYAAKYGYQSLKELVPGSARFKTLTYLDGQAGVSGQSCADKSGGEESDSFFICMLSGYAFTGSSVEDKHTPERRDTLDSLIDEAVTKTGTNRPLSIRLFRTKDLVSTCYPKATKYDAQKIDEGKDIKATVGSQQYVFKFTDDYDGFVSSVGGTKKSNGGAGKYWMVGNIMAGAGNKGANGFEWQWFPFGYDMPSGVRSDRYQVSTGGDWAERILKDLFEILTLGQIDIVDDGSKTESLLNCSWVFDNKDKIFSNKDYPLTVKDDGSYTIKLGDVNGDGKDDSGGGKGGGNVDGTGNTDATCETSGSPLNWMLCPAFNLFAETTDWLFTNLITPLLYTSPVSTNPSDPSFKAWSAFRVYGNIFLIIAMLVIVFGQTIGGGIIDAYTAKKVMPRILVAAILINLSVYIVGLLVDITNVLGKGIGQLMMAPVQELLNFTPSAGAQFSAYLTGVLGLFFGAAGIAGFLGGLLTGGVFLAKAGTFILIGVVLPAMLAILAVFATLVIRRGMILALIMVSPVAFALYCLPNTERYFKKWWELLFQTLLVYPIVVVIFSTASILSATVLVANGATSGSGSGVSIASGLAGLIAFSLQIIPLFLVPFAFKFAGGAIGKLYAAVAGGTAKVGAMTKGRKEQAKRDMQNQMLTARDRQYRGLGNIASDQSRSRGARALARFARGRVGGYNLEEAVVAMRAEQFKRLEALKDAGDDTEERALTVNKDWALDAARGGWTVDAEGNSTNGHARTNARTGRREFRTLGGKWVDEASVDAAHGRWGGDRDAMQWALAYEMQKATTQEEQDYLHTNFGRIGERGSGLESLSEGQMGGLWTGAAFAKQNTDRQWKHYQWDGGAPPDPATGAAGRAPALRAAGVGMFREIDERQGTWQMTAQSADTWTTMSEEVNRARNVINTGVADGNMSVDAAREVLQRGARIARSIGQETPMRDSSGQPIIDPLTGQPMMTTMVGGGAAGRTKEEMEKYVELFPTDPTTGGEPLDYSPETGTARRGTGRASGDTNPLVGTTAGQVGPYVPPSREETQP